MSVTYRIKNRAGRIIADRSSICWSFIKEHFKKGLVFTIEIDINYGRDRVREYLYNLNLWKSFEQLGVVIDPQTCFFTIKVNHSTNLYDVYTFLRMIKPFNNGQGMVILTGILSLKQHSSQNWEALNVFLLDLYRCSFRPNTTGSSYEIKWWDSIVFPLPCLNPEGFKELLALRLTGFNSRHLEGGKLKSFSYKAFSSNLKYALLPLLPSDMGNKAERVIGCQFYEASATEKRDFTMFASANPRGKSTPPTAYCGYTITRPDRIIAPYELLIRLTDEGGSL